MSRPALPATAREVLRLTTREALVYGGLVGLIRATGAWRRGMKSRGDFERMRLLDKLYWLHKTTAPIRRARRGSGLEAYFADRARRCELPPDLQVAQTLRLSAAGDLMNHAYLARSGDTLYRDVEELIFEADLSMANLECVVSSGPAGAFEISTRNAPPLHLSPGELEVLQGPRSRSFSFLATACNHSLDFGAAGVDSTIDVLGAAGISFHGTNADESDARRATVLERDGFRIGVVAFTFGLNARKPPPDRPLIVNRMDLNGSAATLDCTLLEAQLRDCRAAGTDLVVAQLHWGLEHEYYPAPEQLEVAHHLAELGLDVIIGHHPHVAQPLELYRTLRDPGRIVPIFYSLGSLTTPFSAPFLCRSAVARLELARGRMNDGSVRTYVADARMIGVEQVADAASGTIALRRAPVGVG